MSHKKILLMHISNVSGHFNATYVIERALKQLDPRIETLSVNAFSYTNPIAEQITNFIYMSLVKKMPAIWRFLYDNPKVVSIVNRFKAIPHRMNAKKIKLLYERFKPNAVICSQAFPCGMVADFKRLYNINLPLIGVLTDYMPHSFWIYPDVDFYITASIEAGQRLIKKGIGEDKIKCLGIPIEPKFKNKLEKRQIFNKLHIDTSIPALLIMGGGQGIGPIKNIIFELDKLKKDVQLIVVCGTNKKLYKWISEYKSQLHKKILSFGYVDNIDELMDISTLIITKPGGLTTAEAMSKSLPMIIVKPIPGQEENNTNFLLNHNAALKINKTEELNPLVASLLNTPDKLNSIRQAAYNLSHPNAALDIACLSLGLCKYEF